MSYKQVEDFILKGRCIKNNSCYKQELECRLYFNNINYKSLQQVMKTFRISEKWCYVQRFKGIDIYNSKNYRKKFFVSKNFIVFNNKPMTFVLNYETPLYPMSNINCESNINFISALKFCFYEITPVRRCSFILTDYIEVKIFLDEESVAKCIVELEFDSSKDINPKTIEKQISLFSFLIQNIQEKCTFSYIINYHPKIKNFEKMCVLKHPSQILKDLPIICSPKWNGERRFLKITDKYVIFVGNGYTENLYLERQSKIQKLKNENIFLYLFLKNFGFLVEWFNDFSIVFDLSVNLKLNNRIEILKSFNFQTIASYLNINIKIQTFHYINTIHDFFNIPFNDLCDGFIIIKKNQTYKIKQLYDQSIDLLYNDDKKYVTLEGIELAEKVISSEQLLTNVVYELRIVDWKCKYHVFKRVNKVTKIKILKNCLFEVIRKRNDKYTKANSLRNIFTYLESDMLFFLTEWYKFC